MSTQPQHPAPEGEQLCGYCHFPIHADDSRRYFGSYLAHWKYRCHELIQAQIDRLTRELEEANSFRFNMEHACKLEREDAKQERDRLTAEKEALETALEISRTQTKDAFERVALTHNECVNLTRELATASRMCEQHIALWKEDLEHLDEAREMFRLAFPYISKNDLFYERGKTFLERRGLLDGPRQQHTKRGHPMTDEQIKHMVNRFLTWRLPDNFNPDGGINFRRTFNENTDHPMRHEPVGTNLFDATQAEEMIRYMVEGIPPDSLGGRDAKTSL